MGSRQARLYDSSMMNAFARYRTAFGRVRRSLLLLVSVLVTFALGACTTIDDIISSNAKVDYKKGYDFDTIKVMNVSCGLADDDTTLTSDQIERVNLALTRALERRGMTVVGDDQPADAQVSWHVVVKEQSSLREYNAESYYQCWRCGPSISSSSTVQYTQGTFVVDVIDPALSKSVWRGVMQGRLADVRASDIQQARFDKAAREMFAKFPPGILIDGIY
ncbi:MAG: DUF4136 domain-containing protein [Halieaceae bacterium]|nr:DUF4136 domain-containing protein [Halieaceae bacterium]